MKIAVYLRKPIRFKVGKEYASKRVKVHQNVKEIDLVDNKTLTIRNTDNSFVVYGKREITDFIILGEKDNE